MAGRSPDEEPRPIRRVIQRSSTAEYQRSVEAQSRHCSKGSDTDDVRLDIISSNMSYIDQNPRSAKRILQRSPLWLWHLSVAESSVTLHQDFRGLAWMTSSTAKTSRTIDGC
jgi:hypothetical protein